MLLILLLITTGFILTAYLGYTAIELTYLRRSRIKQRVKNLIEENGEQVVAEPLIEEPLKDSRFPTIARFIAGHDVADKLLLMLTRAGLKLRPSEFIGLVSALALILALMMSVVAKTVFAEVLGIFIGCVGPFVYVKGLEAQRVTAFSRQIPDALSLISSAVRSGFSFQRAMQMVSEELPNPLAEEFRRVIDELNVGVSVEAALTRLANRISSYDLQLVVTAIIIQQQIGGNLAEIIDNIAETIRERVRVEGEMAALTAEGKISGVVLVLLPIVLAALISIVNPGYLAPLIADPVGRIIISAAVILQIFGALIIKAMLVVDY
ncbi:MAG: type II secretion system F family protein [Armatimonadota bacterium]|nr:type II secretion system F family protein [bacterium]